MFSTLRRGCSFDTLLGWPFAKGLLFEPEGGVLFGLADLLLQIEEYPSHDPDLSSYKGCPTI